MASDLQLYSRTYAVLCNISLPRTYYANYDDNGSINNRIFIFEKIIFDEKFVAVGTAL